MSTDIQYHYFNNMEFSGLFDITHGEIIFLKYFLFIKFQDKIYIDIKGVGCVIMPFEDFLKNKLLKMYYEISLMLIENKNMIILRLDNRRHYYDYIYTEKREWFIDSAYFVEDFSTRIKNIEWKHYCCHYNINPYDLMNMQISSKSLIDKFNFTFLGYEQIYYFQTKIINYTVLAIDYNYGLIEKELDDICTIQDDKINIIKLLTFFDKEGMNSDIFIIIYNKLISKDGNKRYSQYLVDLLNNRLLSPSKKKHIAFQIISK
jgi:hypothetical protein